MPTRVMSYHGILRGNRLVPQDAIREPSVAQVLPRDVMERFGAIRRAHAVDLHDDKAELGLRHHRVERGERLRHERPLRAGIDALDDRVLLRRIEVRRPDG